MDSKRMIIAVMLSIAIWVVWMRFFAPKSTDKEENVVQKSVVETPAPAADNRSELKVVAAKAVKEAPIEIATDKYSVNLSNKGGAITSLKYKERNVELIVKKNIYNAKGVFDFAVFFNKDELIQGNGLDNVLWDYTLSNNIVKFSTTLSVNGKPLRLEKTYTFNNDTYYFKVEYNLINVGDKELSFPNNYIIVSPSDFIGPDVDFTNSYNVLNQVYFINGDYKKVSKGGGFFSKGETLKSENGDIKWAGVMSRYFCIIMLSDNSNGNGIICDNRKGTGFRVGMNIPVNNLEPGGKLAKSYKVYVGEKNKDKLAAIDISLKDAADVNKWIEPIRDFLLWCLLNINKLIRNFGWSLVIFSILTKIVLLPLTIKSTESMKKMQALTPKMNELKEKYKGKPDVLNKEMMKLYKANKVNPMGGCLPLILQMPFFFALYSALLNSIDLWQAPFIFWIKDLSLPDTVYTFPAFIPIINGFHLNILPIIMTATSFFMQRLTPSGGGGQQQKMMMTLMPLIFIVIFWNMPSGLVLYWTLQNAMQILHQLYSNRKVVKEA